MRRPLCSSSQPIAFLAFAAALLASVPEAAAAPPATGMDAGRSTRVRVHLGTDVFSLIHVNPDGAPSSANVNVLGFGIGRRTALDRDSLLVGGVDGVASLGVGGVILDGRAVVGGQFAFTVDGLNVGDDGGTAIEGRFVPYFNWMFKPFGRVRPFLGAHFGLGGGAFHSQQINDPADPPIRVVTNVIYPVVGVQGGVHIFIVEAVSIDALVNFDYFAPFARTRIEDPDVAVEEDFDKTADVINVAFVNVGISAWF